MASNSMFSELDHLIRDLVPRVFDIAGLKVESNKLRKMPPMRSKESIVSMCSFLNKMSTERLSDLRDASWNITIKEILFWSEASIWTAVVNDSQECAICVLFVKRNMEEAWSRFIHH